MDALRNSKKISLLAVAILFLIKFFNLILNAPRIVLIVFWCKFICLKIPQSKAYIKYAYRCWGNLRAKGEVVPPSFFRVAAIFPDQFQSFTEALKNRIFIYYFAPNHLSHMPWGKQKQIETLRQK